MATEDAILAASTVRTNAKNDQIAGITPRAVQLFKLGEIYDTDTNTAKVVFKIQCADTVIENQTVSYIGRIRVMRRLGSNHRAANPYDGDVVLDIERPAGGFDYSITYEDTDIELGFWYTYTVFVYSDHGICNWAEPAVKEIEITTDPDPFVDFKVWGFYQNFADINPDTTIKYDWAGDEYGVINKNYTRAMTNVFSLSDYGLTNITLGDWESFLSDADGLNNHLWRVATDTAEGLSKVKNDKYRYHECEDGTILANGAYVLMPWMNCIYIREDYDDDGMGRAVYFVTQEGYDALSIADKDKFYPIGFVDPNDNILKGIFLPGSYIDVNSKIISTGSTAAANIQSIDTATQKTKIDALGSRCVFFGGPIANLLRDLEYMIFKSTDIQKAATYGNCKGGSASAMRINRIDDGYLTFSDRAFASGFGTAVNGGEPTTAKKNTGFMFHSRVLGSYDQWCRDPYTICISNGTVYMSHKYIYDISSASAGGKINAGNAIYPSGGYNYSKKLIRNDKRLGSLVDHRNNEGSQTTGLCDGTYGTGGNNYVAIRLSFCTYDLIDGPAALSLVDAASNTHWGTGASVLLLPQPGYNPND